MKTLQIIILLTLVSILSSCVQETHLKIIHFKVDMSNVENIFNPGIKGQFTNPSWQETITLTDKDGDSIYEATVKVQTAQNSIEFKFVNNDTYELQNQNNRFIKLEYRPQTLNYLTVYNNINSTQNEINSN